MKIVYGWVIVFSSFVSVFLVGGIQSSFGAFIVPLSNEFGWGRASISLAMSISLVVAAASYVLIGRLVDRFGSRIVVIVSSLLVGIVLVLLSIVSDLWQLYLLVGVGVGFAVSGLGQVPNATLVAKWFSRNRTMAMSVLQSSFPLGLVVLVPLAAYIILNFGWRVGWLFFGVVTLATIPLFFLILVKNNPSEIDGSPKDSSLSSSRIRKNTAAYGSKIHLIEAVKTRSYLLLIGVFFFCGLTDIPIFTHFIPFALDLGLSEMVAASAFGLTSGFMLLGTFFVGGISSRFGEKNSLQAVYLIRGTSLILALFVNDFMSLSAFSVIFGFSTFAMMPVTSTWLANNYGTVYFATLWGILQVVHEISAAIGVYLFGFIFEMFGSYYLGFAGSIFLAFSAAIFSFFIRTPTSK